MTETDDAELWRRLQRGDTDAFGQLFERHGTRIHGYALRRTGDASTAEDVTAVVFLEAWRRRADVELHQPSALPWLYGVAANTISHWSRSRRRHDQALRRLGDLPSRSPELVERQAEAAAESARVLDEVRRLPRRYREVLVLSAWEGLSHAEISAALGISVGTVKSRLSRARARLGPRRTTPPPSASPPPSAPAATSPSAPPTTTSLAVPLILKES